eukprot:CAMPEP_0183760994 /NCGR_PEP_ID=MMETSP0739-20130205/8130_1 /TAXON_ID=385413 /ORGANISM="Thalassiosira miniscula, Strain CCMP1093" /LENGTH=247 /DNA_ID=CAMNT_0025999057 /DNA_START=297 /DNA_END=1040 /DNA_ORIENTATION=+
MLNQESRYLCHDYLKLTRRARGAVDVHCRAKVCEWIFHNIACAKLQRETAVVAINIMDRFLGSKSSPLARRAVYNRKEYQLVAMTSLYIAAKVMETVGFDASTISRLSRGHHTADDITSCEHDILKSLRWMINGPTPLLFVSYILGLLPNSARALVVPKLSSECHHLSEIAMGDYAFVPLRRSTIAIASVLNSLDSIAEEDFSHDKKNQFIEALSEAFDLDVANTPLITAARQRLLRRASSISVNTH